MATYTAPTVFSDTKTELGYSYVFAAERIREEIADRLDVLRIGLVRLEGDLVGSGSDTVRITRYGALGYAEAMATMANETQAITASGWTSGFDSLTIARHGLAKEESYTNQILSAPDEHIGLRQMAALAPMSWLKTLRQKMCTAGAGITASTGSATAAWSFDDELDMLRAFEETEGFNGDLVAVRHPEALSDLRASLRNEPAYQFPEAMSALQSVRPNAAPFEFLGVRNWATFDVTTSGGAHQGFAYVPGAIGYVTASSVPVTVENPDEAMYIPEYGLVLEHSSTGSTATARWDANAYFGVGLLAASLFPQRKLVSIND